jgi:two-component system OmpR family response regulator
MAPDSPANHHNSPPSGSGQAPTGQPGHSLSPVPESEPSTAVAAQASGAQRVLVVDPHATLRTVLAQRLRQDGHLAAAVATAREAIELCRDQSPDLLVSAELLDESSALRLAAQLHCPVMVLTARAGSEPVVSLLDGGADDVLRKPFGLEELAARCRTLLRRAGSGLQERVCVGPLEVHLLLRQVTLRDQPVELSPREFALLCALLMPPGVVRSRQELLRMAWPPFSGGPRSVDTQVLTLRRKLEQAGLGEGGGIETMRQQGYRFSLDNLPDIPDVVPPGTPANGLPPLNSLSRN